MYLQRFQACGWHLLGRCPTTRERPPGAHLPTSPVKNPNNVTDYFVAHLQSCAESWKRVCKPCCHSWYIRSYFKSITYALVGPALRSTPILCLRNVITLMKLSKNYAMPEPHTHPPHNVWSEVSDMVRAVSLCGLLSPSPLPFFGLVAPFSSGRYWLAMDGSDTSSIYTFGFC